MARPRKKPHEPWTLFLDDAFGKKSAPDQLRAAGFRVECFEEWFRDESGKKRESVKDPEIIHFCGQRRWVLVTTDNRIIDRHREEIQRTEVAILATAHNSAPTMDEWVEALIKAKPRIERRVRKERRPWFAQFNRQGVFTKLWPR